MWTNKTKCCMNCRWYERQGPDYYVCSNEDSEGYATETLEDDCCEEYMSLYQDDQSADAWSDLHG